MEPHFLEWLQLWARWLHVLAGAAWIGTSFYFTWLNYSLRPPGRERPGVAGELWAVHGGGFYTVQKYGVAHSVTDCGTRSRNVYVIESAIRESFSWIPCIVVNPTLNR